MAKKRCTFLIEAETLERLQEIKARTGLSESEQIRQGIRRWLAAREWPIRPPDRDEEEVEGDGRRHHLVSTRFRNAP